MSGKLLKSKKSNFTTVPNDALHNKDLSWKAKGLLCYLLSLSDDWVVYKKDLKNRSTDGYDSTVTAFKELEDFGYISSVSVRDGGLFSGVDYYIHESPIRENPEREKPDTEKPRLLKTYLKKEIKEVRAKAFKKTVLAYLKSDSNPTGYEVDFLKEFYEYWIESSEDTTLLRFEDQKFFDIKRRLGTFTKRAKKSFSNNKPIEPINHLELN